MPSKLANRAIFVISGLWIAHCGIGYQNTLPATAPDPGNSGNGNNGSNPAPPVYHYVYAANSTDNTISAYLFDADAGTLSPVSGGTLATGTSPHGVAIDRSGKFLYVANSGSANISAFRIHAATGVLTAIGNYATQSAGNPESLAVDGTGAFLYSADAGGEISTYTIDSSGGALAPVGASSFSAPRGGVSRWTLALSPLDGNLYSPDDGGNRIYGYHLNANGSIGSAVPASPLAAGFTPNGSAMDPQGRFVYVSNEGGTSINAYQLTAGTGQLTARGNSGTASGNPYMIVVDPMGKFLYECGTGADGLGSFQINQTTGALSTVTAATFSLTAPTGITTDTAGAYVFVSGRTSNEIGVYRINTTNGSLTEVSTLTVGNGPYGLQYQ